METEPETADRRGQKLWREVRDSQGRYSILQPTMDEIHCQEPPPEAGSGEEEGLDRISNLPEAILGEIVSLLPTKEGARTQILSKRWSPIWRRAPLNLDLFDVSIDCDVVISVASRILSTHEGTCKLFVVPYYYPKDYPDEVNAWLQSPGLNNLQEVVFYNRYPDGQSPMTPAAPLPAPMFRFSSCLRVATLFDCYLPDDTADMLRFPQLKKLGLMSAHISESLLQSLIAGCPSLECLLLDDSYGFRCVRINSISLTSIGVHIEDYSLLDLEEIIIENAPSLERFLYLQLSIGLRVSVISAPKLETLGCHICNDDSSRLVFGSTVIQGLRVTSSATVSSTIKILAVNMHNLCLDTIIDLMRCFPCLEKLYVQPCYSSGRNTWCSEHRELIESLDIRLKKVVMFEYRGIKSQVNFARFFILNAKNLETMRFEVGPGDDYEEGFLEKQHRKLQLDKRASVGAEFRFIADKCYHDISQITDVHALSRADPFECCYCD